MNREPLNREPLFLHSALVFLFDFKIILKSEATSLFDVGRWTFDVGRSSFNMFDVRRSSFKTTPYGINATYERLQNNLALMGQRPARNALACEAGGGGGCKWKPYSML